MKREPTDAIEEDRQKETGGGIDVPCFLETTGGKGLHVVVPLAPGHDRDTKGLRVRAGAAAGGRGARALHVLDGEGQARGKDLRRLPAQPDATAVAAWGVRARRGAGIDAAALGRTDPGSISGATTSTC